MYTDKKLTANKIKIRFYYISPAGSGTRMYASIPLSAFIVTEREMSPKGCGEYYYEYKFTEAYTEKLKSSFGNYWWVDLSYELADTKKRQEEIKKAEEMYNAAATYTYFSKI